ncbi:Mu transposase C-terminal domain-containing protein [Geobacter pelophilus]|uniref:Mu transposase C-terminal domain-containing protein n=1 Tax=Geoanaerobacter pelophilus TaxID=60036 RepID=A0AAW4L9W3_9BACT|nr:Mu transposase C-terminal domain-containing protein [Geoanaerobacter pelophilus]MBT0666380.1 Mu transposase C-terminal domain-containing protein [Geoanaerobacter pelophilus]
MQVKSDGWVDVKVLTNILNCTERAIQLAIQRGKKFTKTRQIDGNGRGRGGQIWQVHITDPAIPESARSSWLLAHNPTTETLPVQPATKAVAIRQEAQLPAVTALKDWQRQVMDARLYFIRLIERAAPAIGVNKAIRTIVTQAVDGTLPIDATSMIELANARKGEGRTLSYDGMMKWWSTWIKAGKDPAALAPKSVEKFTLPPWGAAFLACYQQPQKPTVAGALEELAKTMPAAELPSYSQVQRFLKKVGGVEKEKGRRTGQELRSIKPYIIRDTTGMWPTEVYISDGLNFKSWGVAHPIHRRPFSPEICDVVDVATRRLVGWSVGLAESGHVMAAALRHSIENCGIPAGWYHDNGPGYENRLLTDDCTGILTRCGITNMTSVALQSQSRGIIESLRKNLWHKAAKTLPAYKGRDMDRQTAMKVYKVIKKDIKERGISEYVMPWAEFLDWVADLVEQYNNRPHSSLPKFRCPITGRIRHMSPNEAWAKAVAEGWQPVTLTETELADLFLPERLCKVHRGLVRLFGNTYYNAELSEYHGDQVRVGYDIHDPRRVRVRDQEGRLLCYAKFEANKHRYVAVSASQQMIEKRAAEATKRLETKLETVRLELLGTIEVEEQPAIRVLPPEVLELEEKRRQKALEQEQAPKWRDATNPQQLDFLITDLIKNGTATAYQIQWKNDFDAWQLLREEQGHRAEKIGLLVTDPYCLQDPERERESKAG